MHQAVCFPTIYTPVSTDIIVSYDGTPNDDDALVLVGSQAGAPEGRIALSGAARATLDRARSRVLVLPRGKTLTL
jgi:hypothetical protein